MKIAAMQLIKTLRARDALQDRESALSTRQRQILILADGQRTSDVEYVGVVAGQQGH